jgi:D-arabinose 5-phosphate isomerase GutQ
LKSTSRRSRRETIAAATLMATAKGAAGRASLERPHILVVTGLGCGGLVGRTSAIAMAKLGTRPGSVVVGPCERNKPIWLRMMSQL